MNPEPARQFVRARFPGLLVLMVLLLIYSGTLQRDMNGSSNGYVLDVGEIQVALNLWGTIHYRVSSVHHPGGFDPYTANGGAFSSRGCFCRYHS